MSSPARRGASPGRGDKGGARSGWHTLPPDDYGYERRIAIPRTDEPYWSPHVYYHPDSPWSASRPAPPQNPLVAAMASRLRSEGLLSNSAEKSDDADKKKTETVNTYEVDCWRLRMCSLFLVGGTSLQALVVGGQMQVRDASLVARDAFGGESDGTIRSTADVVSLVSSCRLFSHLHHHPATLRPSLHPGARDKRWHESLHVRLIAARAG